MGRGGTVLTASVNRVVQMAGSFGILCNGVKRKIVAFLIGHTALVNLLSVQSVRFGGKQGQFLIYN